MLRKFRALLLSRSGMALFAGTFENKVDGKGRVSVPAPFRAELEGPAGGAIYLYPSLTCAAIEGCTVEWMEDVRNNLKALPAFSPQRQGLMRAIFGRARLIRLDDDGRLVLPRDFAGFAGIETQATFVGMADTFQMWNPDRAAQAEEEAVKELMKGVLDLPPPFGGSGGGS